MAKIPFGGGIISWAAPVTFLRGNRFKIQLSDHGKVIGEIKFVLIN